MKIYSVNNNDKTNFTALQKIHYRGSFDPKKNVNHAEIVSSIKKNKTFKKFFNKFDTYLTFDQNSSSLSDKKYTNVEIFYAKARKLQILGKLRNFLFGENRRWFTKVIYGQDSSSFAKASENLQKNIENAKFEDLAKSYQRAQKK